MMKTANTAEAYRSSASGVFAAVGANPNHNKVLGQGVAPRQSRLFRRAYLPPQHLQGRSCLRIGRIHQQTSVEFSRCIR